MNISGLSEAGQTRYGASAQIDLNPGHNDLGLMPLQFRLGDLSLAWSFDGVYDCMLAGVSRVSVTAVDSSGKAQFNEMIECAAGGATAKGLTTGNFTVQMYGLDVAGTRLYKLEEVVYISSGPNDIGTQNLIPVSSTGDASAKWIFDGGLDCGLAGVTKVVMVLKAPGGQKIFSDTILCVIGGGTATGLAPGYYNISFLGQDQAGVARYWVGPYRVEVKPGPNDLGTFILEKI
ncbi:MAG: hypothetical protein WC889_08190 [Myxococcota bacterium]|jgi:hypothetical protein